MEGDPFAIMAQRLNNKSGGLILRRGTVMTVSPLTINVAGNGGGITGAGTELMVNAGMFEHTENLTQTSGAASTFEAAVTPKLIAGDTVLLLTEDDQLFFVLCKVVSA